MAALIAPDTSTIAGVSYLDRGYENLVDKLSSLGADISRAPRSVASVTEAQSKPPLFVPVNPTTLIS